MSNANINRNIKRRVIERKQVRERRVAGLRRRFWIHFGISIFIVWHLLCLVYWNQPAFISFMPDKLAYAIRCYMTTTGFMQGWLMFAPIPSNKDVYVEALITYKDGTVMKWEFPRMVKLGYVERYERERYRKLIEWAELDVNSVFWPDLAHFAARYNNNRPNDPPIHVELVRHYRFVPQMGTPIQNYYNAYMFYQTNIGPEDLK